MIAWLAPAAAVALAAATLPVIVHLLVRQRAERIVFPSVRFLSRSDESSWRLRVPSDLLLVAVRTAIVACAALALMQPLWITEGRRGGWGERIARAIVVDASDSVDGEAARRAADGEAEGAMSVRRIDSTDPDAAVPQAVAWLTSSEPARREVVIVSDFQGGTFNPQTLQKVPSTIGIRIAPVGSHRDSAAEFDAGSLLYGDMVLAQRTQLAGWDTAVSLSVGASLLSGLEVFADARDPAGAAAVRAARVAGVVAPSGHQPIAIRFRGAAPAAGPAETPSAWARATAVRLLKSPGIPELGPQVSQRGGVLNVNLDAAADSWAAVAVLHATLNARRDQRVWREREPERIPEAQLAAWRREAPPPAANAWRQSEDTDGRWLWLAAIALMAVESVIRRAPAAIRSEAARAA